MACAWKAWFIFLICREFGSICEGSPQNAPGVYGNPPVYQPYVYASGRYVYLPDPSDRINTRGWISRWSFYMTRTGRVSLQVWRKATTYRYRLVDFETCYANRPGVHHFFGKGIVVRGGDVIGFYAPSGSKIPYKKQSCLGSHSPIKKAYVGSTRRMQQSMLFPFYSESHTSHLPCRKYSLQFEVAPIWIFTNGGYLFPHGSNILRSSGIYIPDVTDQLRHSGYLVRWQIYAREVGRIYLQIWRKLYDKRYELVSQTTYEVTRKGRHVILPANHTRLEAGDVLGLATSRAGIIPLRFRTCSGTQRFSLYFNADPSTLSSVSLGIFVPFKVADVCMEYAINLQLSKKNERMGEIGHSPIRRVYADTRKGMAIIPEPLQPLRAETVVGWRLYAVRSGHIHLQIWRPTDKSRRYKLVSLVKYDVTSVGVHNIPMTSSGYVIKDGDLIGFYFPEKNIVPFDGVACSDTKYLYKKTSVGLNFGSVVLFSKKMPIWNRCKRYSIAVVVLGNITQSATESNTSISTTATAVTASTSSDDVTVTSILATNTSSDDVTVASAVTASTSSRSDDVTVTSAPAASTIS